MTHFASFTTAAQLHFGIVTDSGAISMNAAFPQFSSLQDVVVADLVQRAGLHLNSKCFKREKQTR